MAKRSRAKAMAQSTCATPGRMGEPGKWPSNTSSSGASAIEATAWVGSARRHSATGRTFLVSTAGANSAPSKASGLLPCALAGSASTRRQRRGRATRSTAASSRARSSATSAGLPASRSFARPDSLNATTTAGRVA